MGIADSLGVRLIAVGEAIQEIQNIIRSYLIYLVITEILAKPIDDGTI